MPKRAYAKDDNIYQNGWSVGLVNQAQRGSLKLSGRAKTISTNNNVSGGTNLELPRKSADRLRHTRRTQRDRRPPRKKSMMRRRPLLPHAGWESDARSGMDDEEKAGCGGDDEEDETAASSSEPITDGPEDQMDYVEDAYEEGDAGVKVERQEHHEDDDDEDDDEDTVMFE